MTGPETGARSGGLFIAIGAIYWLVVLGSLWFYVKHLDEQRQAGEAEAKGTAGEG